MKFDKTEVQKACEKFVNTRFSNKIYGVGKLKVEFERILRASKKTLDKTISLTPRQYSILEDFWPKQDMKDRTCLSCRLGEYVETSMDDDMRGVLHCSWCDDEIKRHQ